MSSPTSCDVPAEPSGTKTQPAAFPQAKQKQVDVTLVCGEKFASLSLHLDETVGLLRKRIALIGSDSSEQRHILIFGAGALKDDATIEHLAGSIVREEDPIVLTLVRVTFAKHLSKHLIGAASWGSAQTIKGLLASVANPNSRDDAGRTALFRAVEARQGHASIIQSLCEASADVDEADAHRKRTPLYMAARGGHLEAAQSLCVAAADVNLQDSGGITPLAAAANCPKYEVVMLLCNFRASVNAKVGLHCESALYVAARRGSARISQFLCTVSADVEHAQSRGVRVLHVASARGHDAVVRELCKAQASPDSIEPARGTTPLLTAAEQGHARVIEALGEAKADMNLQCFDGLAPLHVAAHSGTLQAVQVLCKARADLSRNNPQGATALHVAAASGHRDIVDFICSRTGEVNRRERQRFATPLHFACEKGHSAVVRTLCFLGGDINIRTHSGKTPVCIARRAGHKEVVAALAASDLEQHPVKRLRI